MRFITVVAGAAAGWPLGARSQQPAMPVIGFLRDATAAGSGFMVDGLRKGLAEAGFVEGRNLAIEYAWTDGRSERLSALAAELVSRHVLRADTRGPRATSGHGHAYSAARDDIPDRSAPSANNWRDRCTISKPRREDLTLLSKTAGPSKCSYRLIAPIARGFISA